MRLAFCYHCKTLSRLDDYEGGFHDDGEPVSDHLLVNWVERHMHGLSEDQHPGGRVFPFEGRDIEVTGGRMDGVGVQVANEVEQVRAELAKVGQEIFELKDELVEDANKCFVKHSRPTYPDRKCIDYHDDSKWLGRRVKVDGQRFNTQQGYLCSYCPYEVNVSIASRGFN
jgi:hypothetical protein